MYSLFVLSRASSPTCVQQRMVDFWREQESAHSKNNDIKTTKPVGSSALAVMLM